MVVETCNNLSEVVLGIDIGRKWRVVTSTGKYFQGTDINKVATDLLLYCQGNNFIYLALEHPGMISECNANTKNGLKHIYKTTSVYNISPILVDPMKTSQTCHRCHSIETTRRVLYHRFRCYFCNLNISSDYNAAMNIKNRAIQYIESQQSL